MLFDSEVERECHKLVECSVQGCRVPPYAPFKNVQVMIDAEQTYGDVTNHFLTCFVASGLKLQQLLQSHTVTGQVSRAVDRHPLVALSLAFHLWESGFDIFDRSSDDFREAQRNFSDNTSLGFYNCQLILTKSYIGKEISSGE